MFFTDLPLVELHRHLDGNIKGHRIWQLMKQHGRQGHYRSKAEVEHALHMHGNASDLVDFLKKLDLGVALLVDRDAVSQVALDNVRDAWEEGLDYVELRFSPFYMAKQNRLSMHSVIEAVWDGIREGMAQYPVEVNLIGILSRTFGVEACFSELDALLSYPDYFVGLDLAGDEKRMPARLFRAHFMRAREVGWRATVHAGEADGPQSIRDAITLLGAERIGHGVAAIQDEILMDIMFEKQVTIESCPTSNLHTNTISAWHEHPLKQFLHRGLKVTLSTDDPGVSNITLANEYQVAKAHLGLSDTEIRTVQQHALDAAFMSATQRAALLKKKKP